jgi:hypothetical protein
MIVIVEIEEAIWQRCEAIEQGQEQEGYCWCCWLRRRVAIAATVIIRQ